MLVLPKATPSELHSTAPEVIDIDADSEENDAAPAVEQDDEADLNALKKTWRSAVYTLSSSMLWLSSITMDV